MNRNELTMVVLLFGVLIVWMFFSSQLNQKVQPPPPQKAPGAQTNDAPRNTFISPVTASNETSKVDTVKPSEKPPEPVQVVGEGHKDAEQVLVLSNSVARVKVTSWGGAVVSAELVKYRSKLDQKSSPVVFDFSNNPALAITGIPMLGTNNDFKVTCDEKKREIKIERDVGDSIKFERTLTLDDGYKLDVVDVFSGTGTAPTNVEVYGVDIAPMASMEVSQPTMGLTYMGVDTLFARVSEGVTYWGTDKIPALFGYRSSFMSCGRQSSAMMPPKIAGKCGEPVLWAAVKNKFFVQILASPDGGTQDCEFFAARNVANNDALDINSVSARLLFRGERLESGKPLTRKMTYYVGPKDYELLKKLKLSQAEVMDFGKWFGWLCPPLLWMMNALYSLVPSYGLAIMVLALVVKLLFLPLTNKSARSMKELQKLQPYITQINEKYKDTPEKKHEAIMAMYREHNINPAAPLLGGCLPMLIQIPVFFALFQMLRSAVELRFASFLWIPDLSEPENLLAGVLPVSLNLLPILMALTTVWQTKMTPTTADPQQQKMMTIMMSVMMLFFMYSLASAPLLYWTTGNVLSLVQLYWQKFAEKRKEAAAASNK